MSAKKKKNITTKPDPALAAEIKQKLREGQLPCAVAFEIAKALQVAPLAVGQAADALEISLAKCQLGLFGYQPDKKIVTAETDAPQDLLAAIQAAVADGKIACQVVWEIAARFKVPRLKAGNVCEGQGIKIKPCQLGAF
jgi:hypothetical protein